MLLRHAVFVAAAAALQYDGPKATPARKEFAMDGWTPKPTSKPQLELLRRQDVPELCGFIDGDYDYPVLCDYSSTCLYDSENSWFGCCTGTVLDDCNFKTACVQSASEEEGDSYVTYCTDELYPYCLLYQSIFDGSTFSHFGCAETQTTLEVLLTTTDDTTFVLETTDDFFFSDEPTSSTRPRSSRTTSSGEDENGSTIEIESTSTSSGNEEETTTSRGSRSTGSTTGPGSQTLTPIAVPTTSSTAGAALRTAAVGAVGGFLGLVVLL